MYSVLSYDNSINKSLRTTSKYMLFSRAVINEDAKPSVLKSASYPVYPEDSSYSSST